MKEDDRFPRMPDLFMGLTPIKAEDMPKDYEILWILSGDMQGLIPVIRSHGKYGLFRASFKGYGFEVDKFYSSKELLKKIVRENKDEWQYGLSQITQREAPEIYEKLFDAVYPELFLLNLVYGFMDNGFGEDPYDDENPEDWTVDDVERLEDLYGDWMELGSESFIVPIPDFLKD